MDDADTAATRYSLTFLADEWEWDAQLEPRSLALAKTAACQALEALIRDELPQLACVYLLENGVRIGVWDWVAQQPH